jgi:hypothetical protein
MGSRDVPGLAREGVDVVAASFDSRQQGQPRQRKRGHRGLADTRGQGTGLLRAGAECDVVAGDEVPEAQPLERVDHGRDRPRLAGSRQSEGVEPLLSGVVAELERTVAEVPQDVAVIDVLPGEQRGVERDDRVCPVPFGRQRHRGQHLLEAPRARFVIGRQGGHDVAGGQPGAAVGSEGAHHRGESGGLESADRIDLMNLVRRVDEDAVGLGRRPHVDLDVTPQAQALRAAANIRPDRWDGSGLNVDARSNAASAAS